MVVRVTSGNNSEIEPFGAVVAEEKKEFRKPILINPFTMDPRNICCMERPIYLFAYVSGSKKTLQQKHNQCWWAEANEFWYFAFWFVLFRFQFLELSFVSSTIIKL